MDTEDERTIANQLAREEKRQNEPEPEHPEVTESKKDSTLPVSVGLLPDSVSFHTNIIHRPSTTATSPARALRSTRSLRRRRPRS